MPAKSFFKALEDLESLLDSPCESSTSLCIETFTKVVNVEISVMMTKLSTIHRLIAARTKAKDQYPKSLFEGLDMVLNAIEKALYDSAHDCQVSSYNNIAFNFYLWNSFMQDVERNWTISVVYFTYHQGRVLRELLDDEQLEEGDYPTPCMLRYTGRVQESELFKFELLDGKGIVIRTYEFQDPPTVVAAMTDDLAVVRLIWVALHEDEPRFQYLEVRLATVKHRQILTHLLMDVGCTVVQKSTK
ncbi:MAG: hypothetical protein LQ345_003188 [Seirophora villosa]|nr:MAG: hypothetical protein LQ345_003188 [Seirophora villosa]